MSGGRTFFPNFKAALNHERTAHDHERFAAENGNNANGADGMRIPEDHLQTGDETCWDKIDHPPLTSEGLRQWEMHAHVDHVFDLVPFWQRGIDAAEKGEVLRLEEFLEKMEGDGGWRTANDVLGMLGGWKVTPFEQAREYGGPKWGQPYRDDWAASQRGIWESNAFDWAASQRGGWGVASTRIASDATESLCGRDGGWGIREGWAEGRSDFKRSRDNASAAQDGWGAQARVGMAQAVRGDGRREELHHFVDDIARQEAVNEERRKQMHLFFEMPMEQKIRKIEETIRFLRTHTQHDLNYNHPFWVDTSANPPRAIWVHPYEDNEFLGEHPEVISKRGTFLGSDLDTPPSYDAATERHVSGSREKPASSQHPDFPYETSRQAEHKRGVFGRLKDKAIGTKEEREEHKRMRAERAARTEEEARQARMRQLEEREAYMRAHGGYAPYHPSYGGRAGGPGPGLGGDNTAALLLGGLAGGLLLGDIFSGGF
ncbi:hypothetical protein J3R83DRAFT_6448 [Lanmaoa asiatica]|nr:hypothetical protein J3R83DRAFT_6448 [Lanmaoa asiatica]